MTKIIISLITLFFLLSSCNTQENKITQNNFNQINQSNYIEKVIIIPPNKSIISAEKNQTMISQIEEKNNYSKQKNKNINRNLKKTSIKKNDVQPILTNIQTSIKNINSTINININNLIINVTSPPQPKEEKYIWHNNIYTTQFYIGTPGSNGAGAWDMDWVQHYGGIDDPIHRKEYYPLNFIPRENPFYFALPYSDLDSNGIKRANIIQIPWYKQSNIDKSIIKNKWIEIKNKDKICYGQWEDCGPISPEHPECDDFEYIFGKFNIPTTYPSKGIQPGLDISPALSDCLGMDAPNDLVFGHTDGYTSWKFIDEIDIPNGPWKEIITTSQVNWH